MSTSIAAAPSTAPSRIARPGGSWWLLLAGFVLVAVSELVAPHQSVASDDPAQRAQFLVEHQGPLLASYVMAFLAAPIIGAMFVRLGCLPAGRGRIVGRIAAGFGALGATGLAGLRTADMISLDLYVQDPSVAPVVETVGETGASGAVVFLALLVGMMTGLVLLAIAAVRAGWAPWWIIALAVAAVVSDFLPFDYKTTLFGLLAALVCGLVLAGARRASRTS
ncbi:hypothetical protein [Microbacterium rhizophilus]|uniref:hypothetical protein n=1 Tax=Microbacterium rhizophilus TaxID=3138934 RepID=UPI0031EF902F